MQEGNWNARRTLVNTDEPEQGLYMAERRVLEIQAKLHRRARDDPHRRFGDLFNLVADPAFLQVAWDRVRGNKGARTAGVDGETAHYIEAGRGMEGFLAELRDDLKARTFRPWPVRQRAIPKAGGKARYLGIATIRDRVLQCIMPGHCARPLPLQSPRTRTRRGRRGRWRACETRTAVCRALARARSKVRLVPRRATSARAQSAPREGGGPRSR